MLITNLCSLLFLPFLVFLITKQKVVSSLLFIILLTLYSPDKQYKKYYDDNIVYCPSSGKIMSISVNRKKNTMRIAIFLNVYNNHTQYIPIESKIIDQKRIEGHYFPAYTIKSDHNEKLSTLLYNKKHDMYYKVYQMTGMIARRLKSLVKINHCYLPGDRLGFIFLGSRVDIELPLNNVKSILVKHNQHVTAMQPLVSIH